VFAPHEILWAIIGLLLTIGGNLLEAAITNFPWDWSQQGVQTNSLGVTYQIGAVLLVGCLGGKNAGVLSQIAYLVIGLIWFPVFHQGGGLDYLKQPTFGYLLGFIPGAWICGYLAFKRSPQIESLAFSCICGLLVIHAIGLSYLALSLSSNWISPETVSLWQAFKTYSFDPLSAHLVIACAVTAIAFTLRKLMFY
jgi:biotin transport system substrate-specific component